MILLLSLQKDRPNADNAPEGDSAIRVSELPDCDCVDIFAGARFIYLPQGVSYTVRSNAASRKKVALLDTIDGYFNPRELTALVRTHHKEEPTQPGASFAQPYSEH
jgi:hypothetical protein